MMTLMLEATLRSLALGAVVWLAMAAIRPRNPHLQKIVWLTVVLACIAMPALIASSVVPEVAAPGFVSASVKTLRVSADQFANAPPHWLQSAGVLYAMASCALILRFGAGLARMARIRNQADVVRLAWAGSDDVRVTAKLRSPATFGSTILLPIECLSWSARKLAAVMAHERSHVRRGDCYVLWIARLHACVFWINPLAWWMHRRLAELSETTSDDAVVAELGDRPAYAELLLEIASGTPLTSAYVGAVEMSGSRLPLSTRIERIISGIAPAALPKRAHRLLAALLVLPIAIASAASLRAPAVMRFDPVPNDLGPMAPRFLTGDMDLEKYYPPEAKRQGIEGMVQVMIFIDADGVPSTVRVDSEDPVDIGFGASAISLLNTYRFSNPLHEPTAFPMKVKFALKSGDSSPAKPLPAPPNPAGG